MSNERVDLNSISSELDKNLSKGRYKIFKSKNLDHPNEDPEKAKDLVQSYSSIISSIGKNIFNIPQKLASNLISRNKRPLQTANQSNGASVQTRSQRNRNGNLAEQQHDQIGSTLKPSASVVSLTSTSSIENLGHVVRCPTCKCIMNPVENYCKYCDKHPEVQLVESDNEDHLIEVPARSNKMSSTTANTSMNSSQMIPVNSFYSKENSSKPRTSSSLLNVSSDFIEDEKIRYEVDYLYVGTYRFLSRTYFRIDSSQITLNFSSKNCLNIDYKLIKLLSLCEAKKDNIKFIFIKIDFVREAVEAIKRFIDTIPGATNGIFKYESINGHEKYYIMKLKHLEPDDALCLRKKLRIYLHKNYKEDLEVSHIFEDHRSYCFNKRQRLSSIKKYKSSDRKKQEKNEDKDEEMQLDPQDCPSLKPIASTNTSKYQSKIESKLESNRSSNTPSFNKYSLRSTPSEPTSAIKFTEPEEMEVSEVKPKVPLPFKMIKNNKIIFETNDSDSLTILRTDLFCLDEGNFLNDKIIEFYLMYTKSKIITDALLRQKVYIFSSFFFTKMLSITKGSSTEQQFYENLYNLVKNWTKNIDIFQYDYLIVPIFRNYHWSLALICFPGKVIDDSNKDDFEEILDYEPGDKPCIIFMDSMGRSTLFNKFSRYLRNFLRKECANKKDIEVDFTDDQMTTLKPEVPCQLNGYDCGIFVLHYVELFLSDPKKVINDIRVNPKTTLEAWFKPLELKGKRKEIFEILYNIYQDNVINNMKFESDEDLTLKSDEEIEIINSDKDEPMMSDDEDK